jgi:hypothetical protein
VFGDDRFHGIAKPGQRLPLIRPLLAATAVPRVDSFVGAKKEDHECQVEIEIKYPEIRLLNPCQANANELVSNVFDFFQTDNLPVKFFAVPSGNASKNNHDRFVCSASQSFG